MTTNATIGRHVRMMRQLRAMTQDDLSAALDLPKNSIVEIEAGRAAFTIGLLDGIARALDTTPGRLLDGPVSETMLDLAGLDEEARSILEALHAKFIKTRAAMDAATTPEG